MQLDPHEAARRLYEMRRPPDIRKPVAGSKALPLPYKFPLIGIKNGWASNGNTPGGIDTLDTGSNPAFATNREKKLQKPKHKRRKYRSCDVRNPALEDHVAQIRKGYAGK